MNRETMEAYYQTFNSGNHKALADFYSDDVVFEFRDIRLEGKEAVLNNLAKLQQIVTEKIVLRSLIIDGNQVAVEVDDTFTAKVDLPDFSGRPLKKGESITGRYSGFYIIQDNRIRQVRLYRL